MFPRRKHHSSLSCNLHDTFSTFPTIPRNELQQTGSHCSLLAVCIGQIPFIPRILASQNNWHLNGRFAELNESFHTDHPVAPFIRLVCHQIREDSNGFVILLALDVIYQLVQLFDCIRLEKVFIVEVVEQNVESLLGIYHMLFVLCWCFGFHSLHICIKHLIDPAGTVWNV